MESLIPPFAAYKGTAPYIFVSYAHKNAEVVFTHITRLRQEGFRIWYDEGIDPGTDWSDEIACALAAAEIFLVFISEAAIASHNVRKEIVFAIDQKKPMLCVHVEETDLPLGLKMQLGNIQALLENRFPNKEQFYQRMFAALKPERTRDTPGADNLSQDASLPEPSIPKAAHRRPRYKGALLILAVLALLGVGLALLAPRLTSQDITFADSHLEYALRQEFSRTHGAVTAADLAAIKGKFSLAGQGITDISPLRHLKEVTMLNLEDNQIHDISPLSSLKGLLILGLGQNHIEDLTPLHGLKDSLLGLSLEGNPVKDLKQLRPLKKLEVLDLSGVPITDLDLGKYLRQLKTVILNADGNGLDAQSLRQFKANFPPNCEIKLDGGKQ